MRNAKRHFKKFGKPALAALLAGLAVAVLIKQLEVG